MGGFVLLVVASVGCSIGLNRILAVVEHRRTCRKIREARDLIARAVFVLVRSSDERDRTLLDAAPANRDLIAANYIHLGDVREPNGPVYRCFVSPDRTVIARFSTTNSSDIAAESATATDVFSTQKGGPGDFARPPTHHHNWLPQAYDARGIIAQHQAWLAKLSDRPAFLEIKSLDHIIEQAKIQHERLKNWRNGHDDDTLLELDLRGLLLGAYETQASRFRRHLVVKPPAARIRSHEPKA